MKQKYLVFKTLMLCKLQKFFAVLFLNLGTNIGWIQIPTLSTLVISIVSIILFIRRQISLNNPLIEFTLIVCFIHRYTFMKFSFNQ